MHVAKSAHIFVCVCLRGAVSRAIVDEEVMRRCQAQGTCTDCIRENPDCVWCSDTQVYTIYIYILACRKIHSRKQMCGDLGQCLVSLGLTNQLMSFAPTLAFHPIT